jgi:hypothetical protein
MPAWAAMAHPLRKPRRSRSRGQAASTEPLAPKPSSATLIVRYAKWYQIV